MNLSELAFQRFLRIPNLTLDAQDMIKTSIASLSQPLNDKLQNTQKTLTTLQMSTNVHLYSD